VSTWTKHDIELAMIREFSAGAERTHEFVRVAILREGREKRTFFDSTLTYSQAFTHWTGKACEMRKFPRDALPEYARERDVESDREIDDDDLDDSD
jgi:hypothetical protein